MELREKTLKAELATIETYFGLNAMCLIMCDY